MNIKDEITVTLRAGEWYWLLGLLSFAANQGENRTLDKIYDQVISKTDDG